MSIMQSIVHWMRKYKSGNTVTFNDDDGLFGDQQVQPNLGRLRHSLDRDSPTRVEF
jgi:hypothetical protein